MFPLERKKTGGGWGEVSSTMQNTFHTLCTLTLVADFKTRITSILQVTKLDSMKGNNRLKYTRLVKEQSCKPVPAMLQVMLSPGHCATVDQMFTL